MEHTQVFVAIIKVKSEETRVCKIIGNPVNENHKNLYLSKNNYLMQYLNLYHDNTIHYFNLN